MLSNSFLGVPQIAHFQVEKMQKLPTVGGGTPPPTPYPRSIATLSRAWSLRSLAKIAPPNVFAHYATVRNVFKFHAYSVNIRLFLTTAKLVRPWTYYKWTVYDLSFFDHDDRHRHLAVRILMTTSK